MTEEINDFLTDVGDRVRQLRKSKGWTLDDLSNASGLHPSSISQVERGERNLTLQNLSKLADGLEVAPYQFLLTPDHKIQTEGANTFLEEMFDEIPEDREETICEIANVLIDWETSENGSSGE